MAFSKAKSFDQTLFYQSYWSKAISHPARIIILTHLLNEGLTSFQALRKKIPLATTTVSQHLRMLRSAGLIEAEEKFPNTFYKLNNKTCSDLALKIANLHSDFIQNE